MVVVAAGYSIQDNSRSTHMTQHLFPPVGSLGFWAFSISAIMFSKALETLVFRRALASVKPHLKSSAIWRPSSAETCLCSGLRSLLFPTIISGTQSAPCTAGQLVSMEDGDKTRNGERTAPGGSGFYHAIPGPSQRIAWKRPSRRACSHVCQ